LIQCFVKHAIGQAGLDKFDADRRDCACSELQFVARLSLHLPGRGHSAITPILCDFNVQCPPAMTPQIDLRSDTVTRPTAAMRDAMAAAPVGDDQYGEDPSTNRLQARMAEMLGKEAALWLPTGTMANQVALRTLTRPGDEVVASRESHAAWHELGGAAANAGVQIHEIGQGGFFSADELRAATKPRNFAIFPTTTLVEVENTHNRAGGVVVPQAVVLDICAVARELGLATFLDGARLWNACAASGVALDTLAAPFDLVAVAFSKGLGAPGGSLLAGSKALISAADRHRRRLGGAMRQNGIFSAAALHAIDHHLDRLPEDHANARVLAERLLAAAPVQLDLATVQTNIVVFHLPAELPLNAQELSVRARARGVLVNAFGPRTVRAVTHLDVDRAMCVQAADVLAAVLTTVEAG
jgi:threonine aldolase